MNCKLTGLKKIMNNNNQNNHYFFLKPKLMFKRNLFSINHQEKQEVTESILKKIVSRKNPFQLNFTETFLKNSCTNQ